MIVRSLVHQVKGGKVLTLLKCSEAALCAGRDLIRLFLASNGSPHPEELLAKKGTLFITLLKGGNLTVNKVGGLEEQALLASSVLPSASGSWRKAVYVRGLICSGLWGFRGTYANWCHSVTSDDGEGVFTEHTLSSVPTGMGDTNLAPDLLDEDEEEELEGQYPEEFHDLTDDSEPEETISLSEKEVKKLMDQLLLHVDLNLTANERSSTFPSIEE